MNSQFDWVLAQLQRNGRITRNEALGNNITRLASIIHSLKKEGMNFTTSRDEGDYVYSQV